MTDNEQIPFDTASDETEPVGEPAGTRTTLPEWQLWPPGSKMQIAIIAAMFGLFNLILILIVAVIVVKHL